MSYKVKLVIVLMALAIQSLLVAQDLSKINPLDLKARVKDFLADETTWSDDKYKILLSEINKSSFNMSIDNDKIVVRYDTKKNPLTAEEKAILDEKIASMVVRPILGDKGKLLDTDKINKLFDDKKVVFGLPKQLTPSEPPKAYKPDIVKIKKKLQDFMNDPEKKSLTSEFTKSAKIEFDYIEYDPMDNLVIPFSESDGLTLTPQEIENIREFIKKLILPALSNYGKENLYDQENYIKMLAGVKLPLQNSFLRGGIGGTGACPFADEALARAIKALKVRNADLALKLSEYVLSCESANVIAWKVKAMALFELNREKDARAAAERAQDLLDRQRTDVANIARDLESVQGPLREYLDDVRTSFLFFKQVAK